MVFSKFISIVFGILGSYYFIIILFDVLQSNSKVSQVTTHTVQFDASEKPMTISYEAEESVQPVIAEREENLKTYLPTILLTGVSAIFFSCAMRWRGAESA